VSERIVNFNDPDDRRRVLDGIRNLTGRWRISAKRWRPRHSEAQRRWYFGRIVGDFHDWLIDQGNDHLTRDDAHDMLKLKCLGVEVADPETGESCRVPGSIRPTETVEFSDYCERCRAWLAEFCDIQVPDPDPAWREKGGDQ